MHAYPFSDKVVVVTGASRGIGEAFARELVSRGARLVLVARSEPGLRRLADELAHAPGAKHAAEIVAADLSAPGAAAKLAATLRERGLSVDVLVNNAGFGTFGRFGDLPLQEQSNEIDLNVRALVELTHVLLPQIEKNRGGIIQVASTAAFQPLPYMAVYAATKAFVLSFSEALWAEYRPRGVRVLALCPGATDTPFFERSGDEAAVGVKASPAEVVRVGLAAFDRNRSHVIQGAKNYLTAQISRLVPRQTTLRITTGILEPRARGLESKSGGAAARMR